LVFGIGLSLGNKRCFLMQSSRPRHQPRPELQLSKCQNQLLIEINIAGTGRLFSASGILRKIHPQV
jgi:hypothetical protein